MSTTVRCAVIGLGMGRGHAKGYHEYDKSKLVAVADLDTARMEPWAEAVGAENCFTDYKKMLREVKPDLVSVALPNFLHAPVSIDALKAGCHVLCEKPMAMNVAAAKKMIETAKRAKKRLGINLSYRYSPQARALKDLADEGFLGQAYHAHTRWTRRDGFPKFGGWFGIKKLSGGGPLIDLGVHRIDLALWLMGLPQPVAVSGAAHSLVAQKKAKAAKAQYDCEDLATGFVRFKNGASLTLEISWGGHQPENEMMNTTVMGTEGTLVHRNQGGGYDFVAEAFRNAGAHQVNCEVRPSKAGHVSAYAEMVNAVLEKREPLTNGQDGLRMQQILDALYKSAATGKEVRIKA